MTYEFVENNPAVGNSVMLLPTGYVSFHPAATSADDSTPHPQTSFISKEGGMVTLRGDFRASYQTAAIESDGSYEELIKIYDSNEALHNRDFERYGDMAAICLSQFIEWWSEEVQ